MTKIFSALVRWSPGINTGLGMYHALFQRWDQATFCLAAACLVLIWERRRGPDL